MARVRVYGALGPEVFSRVRSAGANRAADGAASFDITLTNGDGRVLVEVEGFTIRRLDGAVRFAAPPAQTAAQGPRPLSRRKERLRHNLTQGIRPEEGATAFFRALATGLPQIAVSSLPLPALVAEAGATAPAPRDEPAFARPTLDSDYVAPEGEIETRLASFWTDLLGVAQVGANDSFFDLGGHSLIAVRLFAQIKKTFQVRFPDFHSVRGPHHSGLRPADRRTRRGGAGAAAPTAPRWSRCAASRILCRCTRAKAGRKCRFSWWQACSAMF